MEREIKKIVLAILEKQSLKPEEIKGLIMDLVIDFHEKQPLDVQERNLLIDRIYAGICGYDVIGAYLEDDSITEIMVNGPKNIYYEKSGCLHSSPLVFESESRLVHVIQEMVGKVNRTVNESQPIVDARLDDGSRINAVLPPVALNGPILTIRKFSKKLLKAQDLLTFGTIDQRALIYLKHLVACRYNIFISGGTSTGKTTFLNLLASFISSKERIITIEDSAELNLKGLDNLVSLESRGSNWSQLSPVTIKDLIRTALRMRPDRIIVGEVRGSEALDMLNAMNTGHEGSLSTGHGNSSEDMLYRLLSMVLEGDYLTEFVAQRLLLNALDIMVHLGRIGSQRVVLSIEAIESKKKLRTEPIFKRNMQGVLEKVGVLRRKEKVRLYGGEAERKFFNQEL